MKDSFVKRLRRDESGQTLVLAAIMLPVLIGCVGFAVDVGYAFDYKKQMQMAADSAAMAGAMAVKAGATINSTDLANVVNIDATNNGFPQSQNGMAITVCRPGVDFSCPTIYTYDAGSGAVKVSISQVKPTFFTKILSFNSLTVGASAVAALTTTPGGNTANIVILNTECTKGIDVTSSSTLTLNGSIYINACGDQAIDVGAGSITANGGIFIACNSDGECGNYDGTSYYPELPSVGNPQIPDPLAGLPVPTPHGTVFNTNPNYSSGTHTAQPGIYNDGLTVSGTATVNFAAGEYFFNGGKLEIKGDTTVTGSEVFIYTYNEALLTISGSGAGSVVTMSAPTSGTYKGIWYFQARDNDKRAVVGSGGTVNIDGVIYISNPDSELEFTGGASSGEGALYTVFVVWTLSMGGGGTFHSDFSAIGGSPLNGSSTGLALAE